MLKGDGAVLDKAPMFSHSLVRGLRLRRLEIKPEAPMAEAA